MSSQRGEASWNREFDALVLQPFHRGESAVGSSAPQFGFFYRPKNTSCVIPGKKKILFTPLITSAPKKRPITHR